MSMGIGGGFVMTLFSGGEYHSLMSREMAPKAATQNMFVKAKKRASIDGG
jgi:gamma-glutamyltranspeptidase